MAGNGLEEWTYGHKREKKNRRLSKEKKKKTGIRKRKEGEGHRGYPLKYTP